MSKLTEADREKAQELMREVVTVLGDVNEMEKTCSRIKNETTEIYEKLDTILDEEIDGSET